MDFAVSLNELNITLGDSEDVTFTPEEKQRALTKAWNDSFLVEVIWDSTLHFSTQTFQYSVPSSLTTVKDVYISRSNSSVDPPDKVAGNLWEVVGGTLQFKNNATYYIPDGYTLYLKGNYKVTTDDTITDVDLKEYVVALAGVNTLTALGYKKANLFLKNDLTMAELITLRRELKQEVIELRAKLARSFETV